MDFVRKESEDLVEPLRPVELKAIKKAVNSCRRVNRCFNLLGAAYSDYPSAKAYGSDAGSKRKQGSTGGRDSGVTKRGHEGRARGSSIERTVVLKVPKGRSTGPAPAPAARACTSATPVVAATGAVAPLVGTSASAGSARRTRVILELKTIPIVEVTSDDEDEEEEGAHEASDGKDEEKAGSCSKGAEGDSDDGDASGDDEEVQQDESLLGGDASQELGGDGGALVEGQGVVMVASSHPTAVASRFKH